jgi:hypothetical protein
MQMSERTKFSWINRKTLFRLAFLCLILSFLGVTQAVIEEYNKAVWHEQFDKRLIANTGSTLAIDYGFDIVTLIRNLLFLLCLVGFGLYFRRRLSWSLLVPYVLTVPLVCYWLIVRTNDIYYNPAYMADSPYLLRIAGPFDWALFVALVVALALNLIFFFYNLRRGSIDYER